MVREQCRISIRCAKDVPDDAALRTDGEAPDAIPLASTNSTSDSSRQPWPSWMRRRDCCGDDVSRGDHAMAKAMLKMDARRLIHEVFTTESSHMSLDEAVADFPVGSIN